MGHRFIYNNHKTSLPAWYSTNANTLRYYKLDTLNDSSGNNATLSNPSGVTFTNGYATIKNAFLIDNTITSVGTNHTIFFWKKVSGDTSYFQDSFSVGASQNSMILHRNYQNANSTFYAQWSSVGYYAKTYTAPAYDTWFFSAFVKSGGTTTFYSGTTSNTYNLGSNAETDIPTINKLWIGGDFVNYAARPSFHSMSGFILESSAWDSSKITTQAQKGRYDNTIYS